MEDYLSLEPPQATHKLLYYMIPSRFLAHDAFVRTNRRAIAMMFIRLCLGRACIVISACTYVYGWTWI